MEELYKEVLKRKDYLESQDQTDEIKFRLKEVSLFLIAITSQLLKAV